jgi:hypothetical protein
VIRRYQRVNQKKTKGIIRRHQRGYQRLQKGKLENIEGVIRRYQKETKAVNGRTDNAMSKCLEMSKGKSITVNQIEYRHCNGLKERNTMICEALHKS